MSDTPLFKPTTKTEIQLTTDQMVVNILTITTIGLVVIAGAVAIPGDTPTTVWGLAISALISLGATLLARRGVTFPGRILVPGLLTLVAAYTAYNRGGLYHIAVAGFPVIIILAGLLLGTRGSFIFALLASLAAIIIGFTDINGISPFSSTSRTGYEDIGVAVVLFFMTTGVLRVIIQRLTLSLREVESIAQTQQEANLELQQLQRELEQRVDQRTVELQNRVAQLQTISQVSQTISGIQNLDELLPRVTDLISERFGIYHTGIFLIDEKGESAILQAANSAGGQNMLARGHRLRVGAQGIVGHATSTGRARIALDVGEDAFYFDNPDLPDTRSEIALPLKIAGQTFGALDLQSTQPNAFGNEDIQTLSILADQVAIAIQNARSFEQSRNAVQAAEAAYRQMTGHAWQQFTARRKVLGFEYDGSTSRPITKTSKDGASLDIPLVLREQTIGKLKLSAIDPDHDWTEDEIALARAAAERTALTLETARLLEDAQQRATRERVIGDISASISTFSDMEGILRTAVQQLGRRMGGAEVVLELGSELETEETAK
ncbi:MAG: GAF domain-containing protein [Anaerolineales bacterium]|nr:GAF domain-containing protein [Anaerolineales bacterium]